MILSQPSGTFIDASLDLPTRSDQTHSAAVADIDMNGDVDLYIGNLGGGGVSPYVLLNNGAGLFINAEAALPNDVSDMTKNWYTASGFLDVNNDDYPDLILGQGRPQTILSFWIQIPLAFGWRIDKAYNFMIFKKAILMHAKSGFMINRCIIRLLFPFKAKQIFSPSK